MFEKLIPIIEKANKIAIFTHTHPDGDAMGSSYALKLALTSIGKCCKVFLLDDPDASAFGLIIKGDDIDLSLEDCDLAIALDCADSKRLGMYEEPFMSHPNSIAIDHHVTHVEFAKSGTVYSDISSTCELMFNLFKEMDISINKEIGNNIYVGLATDTGNFKYSCISGDTLRAAGELIDLGVDFASISKAAFDTKPKAYYDLMGIAIGKLRMVCDGKAAALYLESEDFKKAGIKESEANGIVNIPNSIEGVEVGAFIRKRDDDEYKVSLRSNKYIDVSEIAAERGGGGHVRASGYSVTGKTVDEIIQDLAEGLDKRWQD